MSAWLAFLPTYVVARSMKIVRESHGMLCCVLIEQYQASFKFSEATGHRARSAFDAALLQLEASEEMNIPQ
jgi:hypothetical protein